MESRHLHQACRRCRHPYPRSLGCYHHPCLLKCLLHPMDLNHKWSHQHHSAHHHHHLYPHCYLCRLHLYLYPRFHLMESRHLHQVCRHCHHLRRIHFQYRRCHYLPVVGWKYLGNCLLYPIHHPYQCQQ